MTATGLFIGEFRHSVDAKGRVAVPNSFRQRLSPDSEGKFVLQRGRDRTIEVHPLSEWRAYWDRALHNLPRYQARAQRLLRFRMASAVEAAVDGQGRILVPRHLLEEASIKGEAVLAGVGEYFEIWEPGLYDGFVQEARQTHDEDLAELERHGWGLEFESGEGRRQSAERRAQTSDEDGPSRDVSPSGPGR